MTSQRTQVLFNILLCLPHPRLKVGFPSSIINNNNNKKQLPVGKSWAAKSTGIFPYICSPWPGEPFPAAHLQTSSQCWPELWHTPSYTKHWQGEWNCQDWLRSVRIYLLSTSAEQRVSWKNGLHGEGWILGQNEHFIRKVKEGKWLWGRRPPWSHKQTETPGREWWEVGEMQKRKAQP